MVRIFFQIYCVQITGKCTCELKKWIFLLMTPQQKPPDSGKLHININIFCLLFIFIIFVRSFTALCKCLHISWDGRIHLNNFWNYAIISANYTLEIIFQVCQFLCKRRVSTAVIRNFKKHQVSHVTTFLLNLPYCYFLN